MTTSLLLLAALAAGDGFPRFEAQTLDPHVGNVCYAVTTADVDGDGKLDAVAVAEDAVDWYANPSWQKHTIIRNATERDNVCIQPHDIDGDGDVDFALGAAWQPANTRTGGTLQWLENPGKGKLDAAWKVHPIGSEPTIHRIRWGDLDGKGKKQLVVAPLQGRGTKGPNWGEGKGVRLLAYAIPANPATDPWPMTVLNESLHTVHNLQILEQPAKPAEIVLAAWEGVFRLTLGPSGLWGLAGIGRGNQETTPFKGASEVKVGRLKDGRHYVATIEPWHGTQVVVYTPNRRADSRARPPADRRVIDEPVQWGHAVWCADVDNDGDDELIIGQRDKSTDPKRLPQGPGVWIYDPRPGTYPPEFERHVVDDGGVGCEDLVAADFDGDGRVDLLAGGRSTHNVKLYWNKGPAR